MIADCSAEIKIVIFQSVLEHQLTKVANKDRRQIAAKSLQKLRVLTA